MIKITKLIKEGESEIVEFKPSLSQTDKVIESISAFSNANGGIIVIGVSDKGEVLGADIGKRTIESLANRIKQNTDPAIYPSISVENVEGKKIYWDEQICEDKGLLEVRGRGKGTRYVLSVTIK